MPGTRLTASAIGGFITNLAGLLETCRREDEPKIVVVVESIKLAADGALTIGVLTLPDGKAA
jgi:hypothetical protein